MSERAAMVTLTVMALLVASTARAQIEPQPTPATEQPPPPPPPPKLTKSPQITKRVDPIYPEAAQRDGRGGEVILVIKIDATGHVTDVTVQTPSGSEDLDLAAVEAARQLEFSPAEWDGVAGPVAIEFRSSFTPQAAPPPAATEPPPTPTGEPAAAPAAPPNIVGVVRAAVTKDPLDSVEINIEPEKADEQVVFATVSNAEGKFALAGVPVGRHRLALTYTGYEAAFVDIDVAEGVRTELIVTLEPREANAFETVVRRRRAQTEVAKIVLGRDEVKRVPGTFGDPLRVIENLPGLARASFAGGSLIVRGANPEDSGVYFDGVQIPQLYHFQGLKSVVNAEFLDDISFYPGGFGAYYGRATAGIVDISSRTLSIDKPRGAVDLNLLDAGFFAATPVTLGELPTFTVAAAARRSYIDAFLPFILEAVTPAGGQSIVVSPVYWDYQLKLESTPIDGHTFSVFAFGSNDALSIAATGLGNNQEISLGTETQFHRLVGRWTARLSESAKNVFQPFVGTTSSGTSVNAGDTTLGGDNGVLSFGLRDDLSFRFSDTVSWRVGLDAYGESTQSDITAPQIQADTNTFPGTQGGGGFGGGGGAGGGLEDTDTSSLSRSELRVAPALYAEADIEPFEGLHLIPGLRGEWTHVDIAAVIQEDGTADQGAVVDQYTLDPRLTARWQMLPWTTLKAAFGVYHQSPTNAQLSPSTGNPNLTQPRALQVVAGVEQRLTDLISVDVQVYETERDELVRNLESTNVGPGGGGGGGGLGGGGLGGGGGAGGTIANETAAEDRSDNGGVGRTIGLEVLLRHDISKYFYGWIAYTLSQTLVDTDASKNRLVPSSNDQTHILTVVGQANLPWEFSLGARFRLVSGNPTTLPAGSVHDLDTTSYQAQPAAEGATRLPTFHQLDVRLDRKWVFDMFSLNTYVDVLNVYNASNAEGFITDYRAIEQQPLSSLPIVPVVGVSGEF